MYKRMTKEELLVEVGARVLYGIQKLSNGFYNLTQIFSYL